MIRYNISILTVEWNYVTHNCFLTKVGVLCINVFDILTTNNKLICIFNTSLTTWCSQLLRLRTRVYLENKIEKFLDFSIIPSNRSFNSFLASLLSFLNCLSISALILFCSFCSSLKQHAIFICFSNNQLRVTKWNHFCEPNVSLLSLLPILTTYWGISLIFIASQYD